MFFSDVFYNSVRSSQFAVRSSQLELRGNRLQTRMEIA
jgi:hypothetical protein